MRKIFLAILLLTSICVTTSAAGVYVNPSNDLQAIIDAVDEGDVLILSSGTYNLNPTYDEGTGTLLSTGAVKIYKSITIKGDNLIDKPVLMGRFEIYDGASLTIRHCVIDGNMNSSTDQIFNYKLDAAPAGTTFGALDVEGCTITGRADGKGLLYLNVQAIVESVTFNNCTIYGIECTGGDFIDSRAGLPRKLNLTNSTIYNVASARDFIRIDDKSDNFPGEAGPVVTVDHCTLYHVGGYTNGLQTNYRLLYVRFEGNELIFTNNLVVGTVYKRGFTNQSLTDTDPTLDNNAYFECENLTKPGANADASIVWFDTDSSEYDVEGETGTKVRGKGNGSAIELTETPFANAAPDFTLKADSEPYRKGIGDPRWQIAQGVLPYAALSNDNTTLTFYYDDQCQARQGMAVVPFDDWDKIPGWSGGTITSVIFDSSFTACNTITSTAYWFYNCSNIMSITGIENLKTSNVTDMTKMFCGCSSLTSLDVSNFNTANVTDMSFMFSGCRFLTVLDVSNFNTANVTDMSFMFNGCISLTALDVSNFNTANVTNMRFMFDGCGCLNTLDVTHFNTANVTDMSNMFWICSSLTSLDVSNFNTNNVTDMSGMFTGCSSLTSLDMSNFNTANVASMGDMFYGCSGLNTLNVSNFNTANVTDMIGMFSNCSGLTSLDVSNFNTSKVTKMENMFSDCSGLTSLDVSNFNTDKVTDMAYMFYGCSSLTSIYCNDTWTCDYSYDMFYDCTKLVGAIAFDANKTDVTYANPDTGYFTRKGETAVSTLKAAEGLLKGDAYTLGGHRLSQPQKGINIIGGKKFVIK